MVQLVPDTAQLVFQFEGALASDIAGQEAQFTLYVRDEVIGWAGLTLGNLADYGVDWWETGKDGGGPLKAHFNQDVNLVRVIAKDLGAAGGLQVVRTPNSPGTSANQEMSMGVALLIQYQGDSGGQPTRGRVFVPLADEGSIQGELFEQAVVDALVDRFEEFRSALNDPAEGGAVNWAQVLVSRYSGTKVDPAPPKLPLARATAVTNTLSLVGGRRVYGSQRDRRSTD